MQPLQDVEAGFSRHLQVQQHQIRRGIFRPIRIWAFAGQISDGKISVIHFANHVETREIFQRRPQKETILHRIIHNQD
jgi:hypothetical protein